MEDLGALLRTLLPPKPCSSTSVEMIQVVSTFLSYLLTAVLPLFISRLKGKRKFTVQDSSIISAVDGALGHLTTLIFIPLARSFGPLSQAYTTNILSSKHAIDEGPAGSLDIRPDISCLLRKAISDLDLLRPLAATRLDHSLRGIRERVALEAVRELEKNFHAQKTQVACPIPETNTSDYPNITRIREDRIIDKLARKDTLWYLCNILHILFTPCSGSSAARLTSKTPHDGHEDNFAASKLLEDAILTGLCRVIGGNDAHTCVITCKDTSSSCTGMGNRGCGETGNRKLYRKCHCVDEVGHGMILAVVERAWPAMSTRSGAGIGDTCENEQSEIG